jgi:hypothetical protein
MEREIEMIRRYIDSVTSSFEREFKEYEAHLAKQAEGASEDEMQSIGEDWGEAATFYVDLFPAFALETTFVASYAFLEDQMLEIARLIGQRLGIQLKPEDLKDKGIVGAKTYLEKLCGITVPVDQRWEKATKHGQLRNACEHTRGRVKKENSELRKYVKANKATLSIDDRDRLQFTREFCLEVLDNIKALLGELYKLARKRWIAADEQDSAASS